MPLLWKIIPLLWLLLYKSAKLILKCDRLLKAIEQYVSRRFLILKWIGFFSAKKVSVRRCAHIKSGPEHSIFYTGNSGNLGQNRAL